MVFEKADKQPERAVSSYFSLKSINCFLFDLHDSPPSWFAPG